MPTFIGFSTQHVDAIRSLQINDGVDGGAGSVNNPIRYGRKFRIVDQDCVIQDFINALNITQGEVPGRPDVGTSMWNLLFEPQTEQTAALVLQEMQRIVGQDPRIYLSDANVYPQVNGILVELEIQSVQGQNAERLSVFFDQQARRASYI